MRQAPRRTGWSEAFAQQVRQALAHIAPSVRSGGAGLPPLQPDLLAAQFLAERQAQRHPAKPTAQHPHCDLQGADAQAQPQAFEPDLAGSLNNLAGFLSALGQREAALAAAQEAVNLYTNWAERLPEAFAHKLATAQGTLLRVRTQGS